MSVLERLRAEPGNGLREISLDRLQRDIGFMLFFLGIGILATLITETGSVAWAASSVMTLLLGFVTFPGVVELVARQGGGR